MRRSLLAALTASLLVASAGALAQGSNWVKLNVSSHGTISYDAAHVQRHGRTTTVVLRYDYSTPSRTPEDETYDRRDSKFDFDCEERMYQEVSRTLYSGSRVLRTYDMSGSNSQSIRNGTVWAQVAGLVCK